MVENIQFFLNGKEQVVPVEQSSLMLSDFLRKKIHHTGTKVVCAEGDCGACSVLLTPLYGDGHRNRKQFFPINSCVLPLSVAHAHNIITIEGIEENEKLSEVQKQMISMHGSQCGFCTPGFIMALSGVCEKKVAKEESSISEQETKNALVGNLCRCTGYKDIIKSATSIDLNKYHPLADRYFTPEIEQKQKELLKKSLNVRQKDFNVFAPNTLGQALHYKKDFPDSKIIGSGTDLGVVHNKRSRRMTSLLSLHLIPNLYEIKTEENEIIVGARVSISSFRNYLKNFIPEYANYLDLFASPQIKNNATVIGNIANASPIGDNPPPLLALNSSLVLTSIDGSRKIKLSEFFKDYRKTDIKKEEIIESLCIPIPGPDDYFRVFKNSIRKDLDISILNLAIKTKLKNGLIENISIAAGGIAAIPLELSQTAKFLVGKKVETKSIEEAIKLAQTEFIPISDVRASADYRRMVFANLFRRYFSDLTEASRE